jgi:hypothetical protein
MKWRSKKDTGANAIKKIRLIDGFGFTSGYNFLQDSLKLLPFNLYLRSTLFEKISLTAQALLDPYERDTLGRTINKLTWQGDRFRLGRLNGGSISLSSSFQSKPRDPNKSPKSVPTHPIGDPNLLADEQRLQDYARRNPAEFVDFNIPWSLTLSYALSFSQTYRPSTFVNQVYTPGGYKKTITSSVTFSNSFSLTPKWNFTTNGAFDLNSMKVSFFNMSINRDMHCWQMSINVTPVGIQQSFNISISPKSSILQDLRINRTRVFQNY